MIICDKSNRLISHLATNYFVSEVIGTNLIVHCNTSESVQSKKACSSRLERHREDGYDV